jgi:hypothetical protein
MLLLVVSSVATVGVISISGVAFAKKIASLSGDQVVPPVSTNAIGHATFKHPNGSTMNYKLNISGIVHPNGIGIHVGKMGKNGEVIVDLMKQAKEQMTKVDMIITGSFNASDLIGPMQGKSILDLVASMKSGDTYVSVDTEKHPTGEIRGQIELANSQSLNVTNPIKIGNKTSMT